MNMVSRGIEMLKIIEDFIDEVRDKYPNADVVGDIDYMNGNDTTEFDWGVNDRLCEFGYGNSQGTWSFKCYVERDGNAAVFCYPNGEIKPVEKIKKHLFTKAETETLCNILVSFVDNRCIFLILA